MPGPILRGRPIREIIVPQATVTKNDCERCGRTWYSESCTDTAKAIVRMKDERGATIIDSSYDVLCEGCKQTVFNLLKALSREMKKLGPKKPRAKKEGVETPSSEAPLMLAPSPDPERETKVRTPPTEPPRLPPSVPSTRR
jgi:hypothetical protein